MQAQFISSYEGKEFAWKLLFAREWSVENSQCFFEKVPRQHFHREPGVVDFVSVKTLKM